MRSFGTPSRTSSGQREGRRDIQGLRTIAVTVVILNHMLNWPRGGFVGVDIFFVISGYLITGLLLREHATSGTISPKIFYSRRIRRIIPAAFLVVLTTLFAAYVLTPGSQFLRSVTDSIWALLFAANWNLAVQGTDYFQHGAAPSPFQHYWSLAVEEQFYLIWPWLMLAVLAFGTRRFGWGERAHRTAAGAVIAVIGVASFLYSVWDSAADPNWAYFSSISRAWELAAGATVAIFAPALTFKGEWARSLLSWLGLAGIVISLFVISPGGGFPAPSAALPVLATALILLAGERGHRRYLWPLTSRPAQYIGDISYSLYLWHFPVLILTVAVVPVSSALYIPLAVLLIFVTSSLSYRFVENPIRRSQWLAPKKSAGRPSPLLQRQWLAPFLVVLAATAAVVLLVAGNQQREDESSAALAAAAYVPPSGPHTLRTCLGADIIAKSRDCAARNFGGTLFPDPHAASDDQGQQFDCWSDAGQPMQTCSYGSGRTTVALVGDSHAAQLIPALGTQLAARNWKLTTFVGDSCIPTQPGVSKCAHALSDIVNATIRNRGFKVVIVTGSRLQAVKPAQYVPYFRSVLAAHERLVVIRDLPVMSQAAIYCTQQVGFDPRTSTCRTSLKAATAQTDPLIAAARAVKGAELVDLTPYLCSGAACSDVIGNVVVYRDNLGHITTTYSKSLGPYLAKAIDGSLSTSSRRAG